MNECPKPYDHLYRGYYSVFKFAKIFKQTEKQIKDRLDNKPNRKQYKELKKNTEQLIKYTQDKPGLKGSPIQIPADEVTRFLELEKNKENNDMECDCGTHEELIDGVVVYYEKCRL